MTEVDGAEEPPETRRDRLEYHREEAERHLREYVELLEADARSRVDVDEHLSVAVAGDEVTLLVDGEVVATVDRGAGLLLAKCVEVATVDHRDFTSTGAIGESNAGP